jgi:hypothetical protein
MFSLPNLQFTTGTVKFCNFLTEHTRLWLYHVTMCYNAHILPKSKLTLAKEPSDLD